jgi:catechol 2,3-dioxygenase-like lactoylglutathione lyase family enzyme
MFNFPRPKLGEVTAITISSPDLDQSYQFYQKLGFAKVLESDFPFPLYSNFGRSIADHGAPG